MPTSASPYRLEPFLAIGMRGIGKYCDRVCEHHLDFGNRYAVLAALITIAVIPVEACDPKLHGLKMSIVHTIVN